VHWGSVLTHLQGIIHMCHFVTQNILHYYVIHLEDFTFIWRLDSLSIRIHVGDPTSTRDESLSLYISGCNPHSYEPVLWG